MMSSRFLREQPRGFYSKPVFVEVILLVASALSLACTSSLVSFGRASVPVSVAVPDGRCFSTLASFLTSSNLAAFSAFSTYSHRVPASEAGEVIHTRFGCLVLFFQDGVHVTLAVASFDPKASSLAIDPRFLYVSYETYIFLGSYNLPACCLSVLE
jgi:hypothetical protein